MIEVLFCDSHLLVVIKPAGMSTQDHGGQNCTELAKEWVKERFSKPGKVFLEPIHRLDKPASGLVLFARTSKALSRLQEQMREGQIQKTYFARVEGFFPDEEGSLEHFLVHGEHRALLSHSSDPKAKRALLSYKRLSSDRGTTLVEVTLLTGRYHQIRAQFSAVGCPIVGDLKYGARTQISDKKILLHHSRLSFFHPTTKEFLAFESTPPFLNLHPFSSDEK